MENDWDSYTIFDSFQDVDMSKLAGLIDKSQESLGKRLVAGYFETTIPKFIVIAHDRKDYLGAAIIEEITPEVAYVDKFAVHPDYKRNGIGGTILDIVEGECPNHILRAKTANTHRGIYQKKGYLYEPRGEWVAYWKGLEGANLSIGMDYAMNKRETLEARK